TYRCVYVYFSMCFSVFLSTFLIITTHSDINTLYLHDALPISSFKLPIIIVLALFSPIISSGRTSTRAPSNRLVVGSFTSGCNKRSEEHTSELQSRFDLVCRLLLL